MVKIAAFNDANRSMTYERTDERGQFLSNADFTVAQELGTLNLSESVFIYDGEPKTPAVVVTNAQGETLIEDADYTVSYSNNTNVGNGQVTITGKGNYTGTITKSFKITILKTSISVHLYGHDNVYLAWDKVNVEGFSVKYKVEYKKSTWANYYELAPETVNNYYKKSNLAEGASYKFRVTPYVEVNGTTKVGTPAYSPSVFTLKKMSSSTLSNVSNYYEKAKWTNIQDWTDYQIASPIYEAVADKRICAPCSDVIAYNLTKFIFRIHCLYFLLNI